MSTRSEPGVRVSDRAADRARHWDRIYREKDPADLSWYEPRPEGSLEFIRRAGLPAGSFVLDVGAGASTLSRDLLEEGYRPAVLDVSEEALERGRARLGERAAEVEWYRGDVTRWRPPHRWDLWHDRAVLHFLTDEADRRAYRRTLQLAVRPGGFAVISGFAPAGPESCSGLPVRRSSAEDVAALLGAEFRLEEWREVNHRTPSGRVQPFVYCRFRRGAETGSERE